MEKHASSEDATPSSQPPSIVRGAVLSPDAAAAVASTAHVFTPSAVRTTTTTTTTTNVEESSASSSHTSATSLDSSTLQDPTVTLEFDFGTYVGEVDPTNGLRSGKGTLTYRTGNVYEGEWRDGAANGIGEKRYANGDVSRGNWLNGKRSGHGGYLYADGHYFEGMYENDEPNGYGVLSTVGGDRYAGHWKNGKKDGKGRETLRSGQVFVGHWKDGMKQGRGKLYLPGAKSFIFGIWNKDHFFRELSQAEMGVDGEMDVVDQYGLPTDQTDPFSAAAIAARTGVAPPPRAAAGAIPTAPQQRPAGGGGLADTLTDAFLSGVAAIENRLEAFGRAIEKVTTGTEGRLQGDAQAATSDPAGDSTAAQPPTQPQQSGNVEERPTPSASLAQPQGQETVTAETAPTSATANTVPDPFVEAGLQAQPPLSANESA